MGILVGKESFVIGKENIFGKIGVGFNNRS